MTIDLFVDANNNGVLDSGDGASIATAVTTATGTGAYAFTGVTRQASDTSSRKRPAPATFARGPGPHELLHDQRDGG